MGRILKKLKLWDIVIIVSVFVLSLGSAFFSPVNAKNNTISVFWDGQEIYQDDLKKDVFIFLLPSESDTAVVLPIQDGKLESLPEDAVPYLSMSINVIQVYHGQAFMLYSNCPDQICMHMGSATPVHPITCLPNRVMIHIEGESETSVDTISW